MNNLLANTEVLRVANAAAAGQTAVASDVVDTLGYDGVTFIVAVTDMADTGVLTATAQGGAQSDGSDAADYTAAVATYTATGAADGDAKLLAVEVFRPIHRYVRLNVVRGTANSALDCIIALLSKPAEAPVTQGADVLDSASEVSPALA
ncbi:MAG: hypothetical protein L0H73_12535 [Nitrococcus sp.]|nr:hypothetical protein [Nitrococcus sp.]